MAKRRRPAPDATPRRAQATSNKSTRTPPPAEKTAKQDYPPNPPHRPRNPKPTH